MRYMVGVISSQCDYGVVNLVILWLVVNMVSALQEKTVYVLAENHQSLFHELPHISFNLKHNTEIQHTGKC